MSIRFFRQSLSFIIPLVLVLGLFAYVSLPLVDNLTIRWFMRDLDMRSELLANTLEDSLIEYLPNKDGTKIMQLFNRASVDERLFALAVCSEEEKLLYKTAAYPTALGCQIHRKRIEGTASLSDPPALVQLLQGPVHVVERPLHTPDGLRLGKLILVHDMSFIQRRSSDTKFYIIALFVVLAIIISGLTVFIAHWSWRGWNKTMKELLTGKLSDQENASPEFKPLISDLRALMRDVSTERRLTGKQPQLWTPDKLRKLLREELLGDEILVVSNREPYIHNKTATGIEIQRPASGLVTAVEPVMRACSGTWIAHGAGSADHETVDENDRIRVPPENPGYTLRRVWLTEEEEQGYYYGFANEGLWPLCHIAHVRPVFRSTDWEQYVKVNQHFADAVIKEARTDNPVILVQDYHLALLPRMVNEILPKATIITFWHIPWPNPESFGICPWREAILEGLLGSTILGFHTPFHCKNFIETVDRYLETRIEHEDSTISYGGKLTQVRPYPISIAWPDQEEMNRQPTVEACRKMIRESLGLPENHLLGIGVDRLDYTKGIVERFQAVERMLELHPNMIGRFSLIQIASPSRTSLDEYQNFESKTQFMTKKINDRFGTDTYQPVILKIEHHSTEDINIYYRAAEVCMVTSLHDGMNLVAKEFVAERDDEQGVLVLSQFTGAARELHEALIVNPYHVEECAEALYRALQMPGPEQRDRLRSMRSLVKEFNVYRWASRMLQDAAHLRNRERVQEKIYSYSKKYFRRGNRS